MVNQHEIQSFPKCSKQDHFHPHVKISTVLVFVLESCRQIFVFVFIKFWQKCQKNENTAREISTLYPKCIRGLLGNFFCLSVLLNSRVALTVYDVTSWKNYPNEIFVGCYMRGLVWLVVLFIRETLVALVGCVFEAHSHCTEIPSKVSVDWN